MFFKLYRCHLASFVPLLLQSTPEFEFFYCTSNSINLITETFSYLRKLFYFSWQRSGMHWISPSAWRHPRRSQSTSILLSAIQPVRLRRKLHQHHRVDQNWCPAWCHPLGAVLGRREGLLKEVRGSSQEGRVLGRPGEAQCRRLFGLLSLGWKKANTEPSKLG